MTASECITASPLSMSARNDCSYQQKSDFIYKCMCNISYICLCVYSCSQSLRDSTCNIRIQGTEDL